MRYWVSFLPIGAESELVSWKRVTDDPSSYRAALCQIFDSIYLDIPMGRVKFNVNTEYAYLQNFKILQSSSSLPLSPSPLQPICHSN